MDIIAAAKYITAGTTGMLFAGALFFFVGLPNIYDQRFEVLQETITALRQQVAALNEQNAQLRKDIAGLSNEITRLSGYPQNSSPVR